VTRPDLVIVGLGVTRLDLDRSDVAKLDPWSRTVEHSLGHVRGTVTPKYKLVTVFVKMRSEKCNL